MVYIFDGIVNLHRKRGSHLPDQENAQGHPMDYVHRQIEAQLALYLKQFPAVALTGPRQSGKSTLLREQCADYTYITLDDPLARSQAADDPHLFLDNLGDRGIVDEIQYEPSLLAYLKMRIDEDRDKRGRFILTGSQQFSLMKGLSETLAGRIGLLALWPFDLCERREVPALAAQCASNQQWFIDACLRGSFPELCTHPDLDASVWFGSYVQTYLDRDVRTLYDVGDLRDFQRFVQLLAGRCAQQLNLSELARDIGIAVSTAKRWVSVLEAGGVVHLLPPYYRNFGKRVVKAPKVYFSDCGLVCYLLGIHTPELLLNGPLAGPLFENFGVQETRKILAHTGRSSSLYYLRTSKGLEVDLLLEEEGHDLFPIEFKLSKTPRPAMADNIAKLGQAFPQLDLAAGYLLSLSEDDRKLTRKARALPLIDYCERLAEGGLGEGG